MRMVICDNSGHPFPVELSRRLATRGHAILHLHCSDFQAPKGTLAKLPEDPPTFEVEAISLGRPFEKGKFLRRVLQERALGDLYAARAARFQPDLAVACNMPIDLQGRFQKACVGRGIPYVLWLQDIYAEAMRHYLGNKFGLPGRAVARHYRGREKRLLRSSDAVVSISERFLGKLADWGVREQGIAVIPNWAPLSQIRPASKDNDWARRHGLNDKLVALYSGTLGLKHDPSLLWDLALAGKDIGLHVVVVSEGPGLQVLADRKAREAADNLTLLPFQPMESFSDLLGAADIAVAMIGEEAAGFSVPSKILSYLAAGKPVVASIGGENDAARVIRSSDSGIIVPPGDRMAFVTAVTSLAADPVRRAAFGRNARRFAEANFDIDAIADRFEQVFAAARHRAGGRGAFASSQGRSSSVEAAS